MTDQKKQTKGKDGVNPVVAGVTGAVIGVGIAVAGAAAVVLNDKKSRDQVKKVLSSVKDQALDYIEDIQKDVQDGRSEVEEKLAQGAGKAKKESGSAERFLHHDANEALLTKNQI
jgi:hypothetical protein